MSKYDIPVASNHEVLLITSERQRPFIWRPWLFYFILYIARKPWLHVFNILAGNLYIKQRNKNQVLHHPYFFFISLLPWLHFFPYQTDLVSMVWSVFSYSFSSFLFKFFSIFLFTHAWIPGFSMYSFFVLSSGQCVYLFPPVGFVLLYKADLNNSLSQMVVQGHSEQKDENTIFHRGRYLLMWIWLLNNSSLLYFLVTWLHTGCGPVSKGSQKSSSSLDQHLFT